MPYIQKQKLFDEFLSIWARKFAEAQVIVKKIAEVDGFVNNLTDYRDVDKVDVDLPEPVKLITLDFIQSQLEWVSLVAQFDCEIETSFFKDYWMPIEVAGFNYFIDLSTETFHLFKAEYFCQEPTTWYQGTIIKNLANFDDDFENYNDWNNYFHYIGNIIGGEYSKLRKENYRLGMDGQLNNYILEIHCITKNVEDCRCEYLPDKLIIYGAKPTAIGLFPQECKITIQNYYDYFNRSLYPLNQQLTIKGFFFGLKNNGWMSGDTFDIKFPDYPLMHANYEFNKLIIDHPDESIKKYVMDEFNRLFELNTYEVSEDHRIN